MSMQATLTDIPVLHQRIPNNNLTSVEDVIGSKLQATLTMSHCKQQTRRIHLMPFIWCSNTSQEKESTAGLPEAKGTPVFFFHHFELLSIIMVYLFNLPHIKHVTIPPSGSTQQPTSTAKSKIKNGPHQNPQLLYLCVQPYTQNSIYIMIVPVLM